MNQTEITTKPDFNRGDHDEYAQSWIDHVTEIYGVSPIYTENTMWIYSNGYWSEFNDNKIFTSLTSFLKNKKIGVKLLSVRLDYNNINYTIKTIKNKFLSKNKDDKSCFKNEKSGIVFNNGFLDDSGNLIKHSPDHYSRFYMDMDYKESDCPETIELFNSWFKNDEDKCDKIEAIREFIGASLFGKANKYQSSLVLLGDGANGKSTMQKFIGSIFPDRYRAAVAPSDWHNPFFLINLNGKKINIVNELPTDRATIKDNVFKNVISGEELSAYKKFGDPIDFCPVAGHIFSCNQLPDVVDDSDGFWRRLIVLNFNEKFKGMSRIIDIQEIAKNEKQGLIFWVVRGFLNLKNRQEYIDPKSSVLAKLIWQEDTDHTRLFIKDYEITTDKNKFIQCKSLYNEYKMFADDNGVRQVSANTFGKRLSKQGIQSIKIGANKCYPITKKHFGFIEEILPETIKEEPKKSELPKEKIIEVLKSKFKITEDAKTSIGVVLNTIRFDTKNQNLIDQDIIDFLQTMPKTKINEKFINFDFKAVK